MIVQVKRTVDEDESVVFLRAQRLAKGEYCRIVKKSLDARRRSELHYVYSVEVSQTPFAEEKEEIGVYRRPEAPVAVVGFGPAGMFCALRLARAGFKPLVIERGEDADARKKSAQAFFSSGTLNEESNVQYGEGGAGAFSDGKLNSGIKSPYRSYILQEFVRHGAAKEVEYLARPHVGSDVLPRVVKSIREEIIALGGTVTFSTRLDAVENKNGRINAIWVKEKDGRRKIEVSEVILAIGHSSRDTYRMLFDSGIVMESKDCAVGVRVEHKQDRITISQYGRDFGVPADYKLTAKSGDRGVFSFCMCPGGVVMPAASEEGGVVTNGMSEYARDGENANSAIVCQVRRSDFGAHALDGMDFLRKIEQRAFALGGGGYLAPAQNVVDFLRGRASRSIGEVKPTYARGVTLCPMDEVLPPFIATALREGLGQMNRQIAGFCESGILTAPETRTSSPVRIVRGEDLSAVGVSNLYPAGEVGYAGGILSSAVDGVKIAEKIKRKYQI